MPFSSTSFWKIPTRSPRCNSIAWSFLTSPWAVSQGSSIPAEHIPTSTWDSPGLSGVSPGSPPPMLACTIHSSIGALTAHSTLSLPAPYPCDLLEGNYHTLFIFTLSAPVIYKMPRKVWWVILSYNQVRNFLLWDTSMQPLPLVWALLCIRTRGAFWVSLKHH